MAAEDPKRIAVFASGSGSNYEAIMNHFAQTNWKKGQVVLLICDQPGAYVTERAKKWGTPSFVATPKAYPAKKDYEADILQQLYEHHIDFIVLAGYMRLLGPTLLKPFKGKILNVHPSLLPAFTGLNAIGQALDYGVRITGVTIHYVDEGMDTGPIIAQQAVHIEADEARDSVTRKIQNAEHSLYPKIIQDCIEERVQLKGGKVVWQQQSNVR